MSGHTRTTDGELVPGLIATESGVSINRDAVLQQLELAHDELSAMCRRQWDSKPAIRWCIPARTDDSDFIIGTALRLVIQFIKEFQKAGGRGMTLREMDYELAVRIMGWTPTNASRDVIIGQVRPSKAGVCEHMIEPPTNPFKASPK
ncbi:MAG: hypothetical protein ACREJN_21520 [Nitrospiraceae bacterium]